MSASPTLPAPHLCAICGADAPFGFGSARDAEAMLWGCGAHRETVEDRHREGQEEAVKEEQRKRLAAFNLQRGKLL